MVIKIFLTMKNNHNSRSSIFSRMRNLRTQSSQSMMGHNHCQMMMNVNLSLRVQHHHRRHEQHTSASGYIGNTAGESGTQPHHRSFSLSSLSSIVAQQGPRKSIRKVSNLRRPSQTASTSVSPNTCTAGHGLVVHGKISKIEDDEDQC